MFSRFFIDRPIFANVIAIVTMMAIVLVMALSGDVAVLAKATSVLLLSVFVIVNVALIVLKRRTGEPQGAFRVPAFVPALGVVVCLAMLSQSGPGELRIAAIILLVIAALYFVLRPKTLPE